MNIQIVNPNPNSITTKAGETIAFDVVYTTDPADQQTSGTNLFIHFNNTDELKLKNKEIVTPANQLLDLGVFFDNGIDLDSGLSNSADTDYVWGIAWGDTSASWPPSQPTILAKMEFEVLNDFNGTNINFTSTQNAPGYEFQATSLQINQDGTPDNNPPTAVDDNVTTNENTSITIDVLANDSDLDDDNLTINNFNQGSNGKVELVNGELLYTPNTNFNGQDTFSYTISDGKLTNDATVTVNVLPVEEELNIPLNRFQNGDRPSTYLFAGEEESKSIRQNFPNFIEEGIAFKVADQPKDDLIQMNRFQNKDLLGTYLYAGVEESKNIRQNFTNFIEEGIAFYVYPGEADQGVDFYRFQNKDVPGSYIFVGEEERQSILVNNTNFIEEGIAFGAAI